jgi:hypothetical protein
MELSHHYSHRGHAIECTFKRDDDDKKNSTAQLLIKKLRPVVKYTASAISTAFTPKMNPFRKREA